MEALPRTWLELLLFSEVPLQLLLGLLLLFHSWFYSLTQSDRGIALLHLPGAALSWWQMWRLSLLGSALISPLLQHSMLPLILSLLNSHHQEGGLSASDLLPREKMSRGHLYTPGSSLNLSRAKGDTSWTPRKEATQVSSQKLQQLPTSPNLHRFYHLIYPSSSLNLCLGSFWPQHLVQFRKWFYV